MQKFIIIIVSAIILICFFSYIIFLKTRRKKGNFLLTNDKFQEEYKYPTKSENLPFKNNILATYTRLICLRKMKYVDKINSDLVLTTTLMNSTLNNNTQ